MLLTLENLPADYDLTLYKDIAAVYADLLAPRTRPISIVWKRRCRPRSALRRSVHPPYSPSAFSRPRSSPSAFSPSAFSVVGV
ncbi:MAG: hypothetical protein R3A10_13690 [Caldilineaceae bacterium]